MWDVRFLKHQKMEALLASQKEKISITKMWSFSLAIEDTAWKGAPGVSAQQQGNGALWFPLVTVRDYFTFTLQSSDIIRLRSFLPADSAVVLNRMFKVLLSALVSVSKSKLANSTLRVGATTITNEKYPHQKRPFCNKSILYWQRQFSLWGQKMLATFSFIVYIYTRVVLILKL